MPIRSASDSIPSAKLTSSGQPLVSAIVSTYNDERFIRGCMESLTRQTIADLMEIIVVVSGSTEREVHIVREFEERAGNITCLRTAQREGLYTAWNRAIRLARGRYVANHNTDDRLHPLAYERMASALEAFPDVALVYCDCLQTQGENETFESTSSREPYQTTQDHCLYDLLRFCYIGPFPMWRRSLHDELGGFDEDFVSGADYEFWLRVAARHKLMRVRETLGLFLNRDSSLSHLQRGYDESLSIIRRARRTVPLDAVFPALKSANDPAAEGMAWAAMAELCVTGPWLAEYDLALHFLEQAERHGAPALLIQNNRAVFRALDGDLAGAAQGFERCLPHPTAQANLVWLRQFAEHLERRHRLAAMPNSAEADAPAPQPRIILAQHPVVDDARRKFGVDPKDIPPLRRTARIGAPSVPCQAL